MFPVDRMKVDGFGGMICILNPGLTIWKVLLDHGIIPTRWFIGRSLIPFDIDVGGRPLQSGTESFKLNPQLERLLQSSMSGLNASRKIRGDRVSPWKTPCLILKLGVVCHLLISTKPGNCA